MIFVGRSHLLGGLRNTLLAWNVKRFLAGSLRLHRLEMDVVGLEALHELGHLLDEEAVLGFDVVKEADFVIRLMLEDAVSGELVVLDPWEPGLGVPLLWACRRLGRGHVQIYVIYLHFNNYFH